MSQKCAFCNTRSLDKDLGRFYKLGRCTFHSNCMIFSTDIRQNPDKSKGMNGFEEKNINDALNRGKTRICVYCSKKGATVVCLGDEESTCDKSFHLPCALASQETSHEYYGQFKSFCIDHNTLKCIFDTELITGIVIKPDCCGNSGRMHDECIERYVKTHKAQSKCPYCMNKPRFRCFVGKYFDIEISTHNPSFAKTDRNDYAYYLRCAAKKCKCVEQELEGGRDRHDQVNRDFNLVECIYCASHAIHRLCGGLQNKNEWICFGCNTESDGLPEDDETEKATSHVSSSARYKKTVGIKNAPPTKHEYPLRNRNRSTPKNDRRMAVASKR